MAAPYYLPWTGDPDEGINPQRPAITDFGGIDKADDADYPPNPTDPEASEWLIDVRFSAGVPSVYAVYSANPELTSDDIDCQDTATGRVTLVIPATKLPDLRWGDARPQATGDNTGLGYRSTAQTLVCEVRTAGALANVDFMAVWG
jgi:hypothetical protein